MNETEQHGEVQEGAGVPPAVKAARAKESESLAEIVRTIVYALAIALLIRTFTFQPFNIPSGSMIPSLLVGDYLFVSKYAYGYSRYSFPFGPPLFRGRLLEGQPERGDIVVFKWPADNSTDYIKRVIGLPGDRVQMRGGVLHINGAPVQRRAVEDFVVPVSPNMPCHKGKPDTSVDGTPACRYHQYRETLPNGRSYMTLDYGDNFPHDNTREFIVPDGHYFMLGDNRDDSSDSRVAISANGVGLVPAANLVGRAEVIFFSTDGSAHLWTPWRWVQAMRTSRLFNSLR